MADNLALLKNLFNYDKLKPSFVVKIPNRESGKNIGKRLPLHKGA